MLPGACVGPDWWDLCAGLASGLASGLRWLNLLWRACGGRLRLSLPILKVWGTRERPQLSGLRHCGGVRPGVVVEFSGLLFFGIYFC